VLFVDENKTAQTMIELKKPVIFFDLETTGLEITKDQIVELAAYKLMPDGSQVKYYSLFKPTVEISPEAKDLHGLDEEKLKDAPIFKEKAQEVFEFFKDCDLGGYNVLRFDIPMLVEELHKAGIHYNPLRSNVMDVFKILQEMEPRNLGVTLKFYTGREMENAHTADADIIATIDIFEAQIKKYGLSDIEQIQKDVISKRRDGSMQVDFGGMFYYKEGKYYFSNGKHKGQCVDKSNVSYIDWMMKADFSYSVKHVAQMIKKKVMEA
jgi:DNA polymerase III subunit epsilon